MEWVVTKENFITKDKTKRFRELIIYAGIIINPNYVEKYRLLISSLFVDIDYALDNDTSDKWYIKSSYKGAF